MNELQPDFSYTFAMIITRVCIGGPVIVSQFRNNYFFFMMIYCEDQSLICNKIDAPIETPMHTYMYASDYTFACVFNVSHRISNFEILLSMS